jgi:hypothetical protein
MNLSVLVVSVLVCAGCQSAGIKGPSSQWVKGKALSVQVIFSSPTSAGPPMLLEIRNDSASDAAVLPIAVSGWFANGGRLESGRNPHLLSARYYLRRADGSARTIQYDPAKPDIVLQAGESVQLGTLVYWDEERVHLDVLQKARVELGSEGSPVHEVFTIQS